jgi:hypothetical protein
MHVSKTAADLVVILEQKLGQAAAQVRFLCWTDGSACVRHDQQ